jgi:hypothetical protein
MNNDLTWDNAKHDPMIIEIKHHGHVVLHFFLGEAMEGAGRQRVMSHVRACDHSPWLKEWREHAEEELLYKLKDDHSL